MASCHYNLCQPSFFKQFNYICRNPSLSRPLHVQTLEVVHDKMGHLILCLIQAQRFSCAESMAGIWDALCRPLCTRSVDGDPVNCRFTSKMLQI